MGRGSSQKRLSWIVAASLFCLCLAVYISRMAPSVVPGDPGEYQLVAARWGIGHPPGYGLYALLGNIFTHLFPFGTYAWRANLLSAVCGAAIVVLTYGIGQVLNEQEAPSLVSFRGQVPSVLGALALASGIDLWQHALHANAHIVTAMLATLSIFCLLRWWRYTQGRKTRTGRARGDHWLLLFCTIAGLSPVQHPLLVFAFPAYALFVIVVRPRLLSDPWRERGLLLKMFGFTLVGLTTYLYYPIRCAIGAPPAPGPSDMHTWAGFLRVVTAQGLRGNLLGFTLREILQRLWDIRVPLNLQYALPGILLAAIGFAGLWVRRWRPALLLTGYLACIVFVTVNVLQDEMAYLLGPMVVVGVLIGIGADVLIDCLTKRTHRMFSIRRRWVVIGMAGLLAISPFWLLAVNWVRMDLHDFRDADEWLDKVEARFVGQGQQAALLTEWERMTTVYYYAAVEGRMWDEKDIRFIPISAGTETPFLEAVDDNIHLGPVYLTTYRPQVTAKYRLIPSQDLWQALLAWPRELPAKAHPVDVSAEGRFEIVGWRLDRERAQPGDVLLLDLYMRLPGPEGLFPRDEGTEEYYLPWVKLGATTYHFTTDSRFTSPWWQPGEIVIERFEVPIAWRTVPGHYPLQVGVRSVSEGRDLELEGGETSVTLSEVTVAPAQWRPSERKLDRALGNLNGGILLRGARVNGRRMPADRRLTIRPVRRLRVVLEWEALRPIDENYKVFVQLLDTGLQIRAQGDDKAPLGGSAPTLLWFPRWRRGTQVIDTYELDIPPDLPPGQYPLVVGMYGFSSFKRVQVVSPSGDMAGDWITLTHLWVE